MAIKAIINNTEKEIEQIKNSDEQDIDYVYSRIGDTEVEGELPISIKSIGGNLADYRIYGQTVDGESVGDRTGNLFYKKIENANISSAGGIYSDNYDLWIGKVTAGETYTAYNTNSVVGFFTDEPNYGRYTYNSSRIVDATTVYTFTVPSDCSYVAIRFLKNATYAMLNSGSTPHPYEPYGYKVPVTVEGKNLFDETYPSIVSNTIKYKSIYVGDGQFTLSTTASVYSGTTVLFLLAGIAAEGSDSATNGVHANRTRSVASIDGYVTIGYRIRGTIDPRNYNTMLNAGSTPLPYEPYHTPVTTPIYLPEQIKKVGDEAEYIDYGEQKMYRIDADDIDVTLPALSTIKGTNTFSVNTSIQPSNMYIKDNFDYKRIFTATRVIEDELPLSYRSIEDNDSALNNYRIYGNTETLTRSYSGSAPLSFPIVDGAVSNYRIYGNTENGESVGDLVTDGQSEHYGKYAIPIANNAETANIYLDEPLRKVGDEAEYVDYAEQKWHRVRKNLFDPSTNIVYGSLSSDGTFVDYDRSVVTDYIPISAGIYTFNTDNPNLNYGYLCAYNSGKQHIAKTGKFEIWLKPPITFSMLEDGYIRVVMRHDTTIALIELSDVGNIMLNVGAGLLPYEPYIENTEVDVTLPALPAQYSTNSLSVGTVVQPSSVAVEVDEVVSCGDRTENLFDPSKSVSGYVGLNGNIENSDKTNSSDYIGIIEGLTYTLTLIRTSVAVATNSRAYAFYDVDKHFITPTVGLLQNADTITTQINVPQGAAYFRFSYDLSYGNIMLNSGSTALPYEPYGYKIPVTLTAGSAETTDIYLDEPLEKSGNNADYIDYATQKRHNSDGTESSVTLPEISTLAGTNTLTVRTEVQPSSVEIKGHIK